MQQYANWSMLRMDIGSELTSILGRLPRNVEIYLRVEEIENLCVYLNAQGIVQLHTAFPPDIRSLTVQLNCGTYNEGFITARSLFFTRDGKFWEDDELYQNTLKREIFLIKNGY